MNNLPQKNVIYDIETKSVLPYKKENDVITNSQNFRSNTINNIFSQLVDNDRFIENKIIVGGKNMDGPKTYSDEQIDSLENGSKILSSAASTEQLLILRKQDKSVQESMEIVLGGMVNVLCRDGNRLLVGTSYGLFKTDDGISYEKTYDSDHVQLDGDVTCIKSYPGTVFFGMDGDVYASSVDDEGKKFTFAINANDFGDRVNDMCYLPRNGELYVSADKGMFKARIKNMLLLTERSLVFSQVCQIDDNGMIDPFRNFSVTPLEDENDAFPQDLVVATEKGILAFDTVRDGLMGLSKVLNGETCYFADGIGGDSVLVGTYHGLMDGIGNSVFETETPVACFCMDGDTRYYFSDSKVIKAEFIPHEGSVQADIEEIPFDKSVGDYALGMFSVDQQGGGHLIVIHTRGGQLITFLPETKSFTVITRSGIERAGQTDDGTLYLVNGGQMYRYSVHGTGIQKSDDVLSVQMLTAYDEDGSEIAFGEALKVIQDESGKSVVLTKKSIIAVDDDGTGRYMIPRVVDCDYVGMVKLQNPIRYNYYPISADWKLYQQWWSNISDDVYEIDYTYAAVRGKDGKIFVDLVNGPEIVSDIHTSPALSGNCILTLSTNTYFNQDFQYPIDIKQDQDFLYVLATDGMHYVKNQDIEIFIQNLLSGDILNKWFQVQSQDQMNLWRLHDSNSNNRIAKTGDEVFILSSGNVLRAGFETFYSKIDNSGSWNSRIKNIIPIGELSQFYVVVENEVEDGLSDQVCCVCLSASDFERQDFKYSNTIIFPTENERISDFCEYVYDEEGKNLLLFSSLSVLSVNLSTKKGMVLNNTQKNLYDTISGIYIEELSTRYEGDGGDDEEQYPVDYVIKAIKYELSSGVHSLMVNFTSADFSGNEQPVSSLTSFDNLLTSISLTGYSGEYNNLSSISSLNSFHFPNGFVKIEENISSVYFPTVKTIRGTYIYGTLKENNETYVSCALDYEVVVSGFNRADISFISAVYDITEATKENLKFDQFNFGTPTTEQSVLVTYVETDFDSNPLDFSLSGWLVQNKEFSQRKFSRNENGVESSVISTDIKPIIGNVEQFNSEDVHVEMFRDDAVIAKVGNNEQMYQLGYDQNGPKVEYLETIIQWDEDSELKYMISPTDFNVVVSCTEEDVPSEDDGEIIKVSTLYTTNMFHDVFGIDEENVVFVNQIGEIIRRDDDYFIIHGTSISGIGHMIDDDGRIYLTSSDNDTSSCVVYRFDGTGTSLEKIETIDFVPDQIFRVGKKIYATLNGSLVKRGSDGYDHEILSSGFVQEVNHVQTVEDTTMVATNLGIAIPTYKMQQGVDVKVRQIGTTQLSSIDEIMSFYGNTVKIVGTKSNEQKKSLMSLDANGVFIQDGILGTDKFTNIAQVKGTQDIVFSDGSTRLSIFHDGNIRDYPFGGNALSVIAANFQDGRTYICTRNGLYFSDGFGPQDAFTPRRVNKLTEISSCGRFLHYEDEKAMIPTNNGIYTLQKYPNLVDTYTTTYSIQGDVSFVVEAKDGYLAGTGYSVMSSGHDMQFQGFLESRGKVNDAYCKNDREHYIATDSGLFRTSYGYKLVNDTYVFSEDELYDIFMDKMQEINDEISGLVDRHVYEQHSENSFITKMDGELLSSDFSGVDLRGWSFQHFNGTSSEQTVDNDVVYDVEFGTNQNGDVHVQISNFLTSDSNPQFSYIRKHWYSGINELYIYLPTTYTYYIPHVDGSTDCQVDTGEKIQRKNLIQFGEEASFIDSSINGHHTDITVTIPDTMAIRMDCILDVHINGNSLPLKIYRDEQFSFKEGDASKMYHSAILPSEVTYFPTSVDDRDQDGQYRFGFACFGQDAQAIRIMYYDSESHVDENSFTIRYNGNGAFGSMQDQVMRLAPNTGKHLRKCQFYWSQSSTVKIFLGWSFNPKAVQPDLSDGQVFEWTDYQDVINPPKAGSVLQLFAIWVEYNGEDGYTELIMDMDGGEKDDEED